MASLRRRLEDEHIRHLTRSIHTKHISRAFYLKPAEIQPLSLEDEVDSCTVSVMDA